jgi:hypothetical protein
MNHPTQLAALTWMGLAAGLSPVQAMDLVTDGKASATIVLPDEANDTEQKAAKLLVTYVKRASGAELKTVKESDKPAGTLISVGRTRLAEAAGLSLTALERDGYRLLVKDGVLYVFGRDLPGPEIEYLIQGAQGSLRAVTGLLEKVGFRWLYPAAKGVYIPALKTVAVPDDLKVTDRPPFVAAHGAQFDQLFIQQLFDWSMANNFRCAVNIFSRGGHTWSEFVPASLWDTHPVYFRMKDGKRVQPTKIAHFLCPSNPDVQKLLADGLRKKFDEGFDWVQLGQSDGYQPCECEACRALDKPGEHHEQVQLAHYNVIKMVEKTHPDKKVHLLLYGPTTKASAKFDKYPPNAVLELCDSDEASIRAWAPRAPGGLTIYVYYFGTYHPTGLAPKMTPRQIAEEIRKFRKLGVIGVYFCGGSENWGAEGPTYYAAGRLFGNPDLDPSALLDEYCALTFGKADKPMRSYFDLLFKRLEDFGERGWSREQGSVLFTNMFPPDVLKQLKAFLDQAKTDAAGDERAVGAVRVADICYRHYADIARVYNLHAAYEADRTEENLKRIRVAVAEFKALTDEIVGLDKTDPAFVRDYFARWDWYHKEVKGNGGMGFYLDGPNLTSPFTWDFDALLAANVLPGKNRARAVITRLDRAPALDGTLKDPAWEKLPWVDMPEVSLGKLEAKTRFKMGYDDQSLYFGFECEEPLIEDMKVLQYHHDGDVFASESIELFFDPEVSGTKFMHIIVGPAPENRYDSRKGYIIDQLSKLVHQEDTSWNPDYTHAYQIDKANKKWTIEVAIPFASLGEKTPVEGQRWRGNFARERHKQPWNPEKYAGVRSEFSLWSPNLQKVNFCDASIAGDLFFNKIPEGR